MSGIVCRNIRPESYGLFYFMGSASIRIDDITVYDIFLPVIPGFSSSDNGGLIGVRDIVMTIGTIVVNDTTSDGSGGVLSVWGSANVSVDILTVSKSTSNARGGVVAVSENGIVAINSLEAYATSSQLEGGVLSIEGKGNIMVGTLRADQSFSEKCGGVLYAEDKAIVNIVSTTALYTFSNSNSSGGVMCIKGSTKGIFRDITATGTSSRPEGDGGVLAIWGKSIVNVTRVTAYNTWGKAGGIVAVGDDAIVYIDSLYSFGTSSLFSGGAVDVEANSNTVIRDFFADGTRSGMSKSGAVLGVRENATIVISNMTVWNSVSGYHGGVAAVWDNGNVSIQTLTAFNTSSKAYGGVIYAGRSNTFDLNSFSDLTRTYIGKLTTTTTRSQTSGGVIAATSNAIITIDIMSSVDSQSLISGGAVVVSDKGRVTIRRCEIKRSSTATGATGGAVVQNSGALFVSEELIVTDTFSGGWGGVVAVVGSSASFVVSPGSVLTFRNTMSTYGGGVLYCGMGSTCLLDDVLLTVDGSRSTMGPGGFLHVAGGGRTIVAGRTVNTNATNVT
eukprot:PhF_6_TR42969/c0_g2_i1/m.65393